MLGRTYKQTGDFNKAVAHLTTAAQIEPTAVSYADLAEGLRRKKDFEGARSASRKALELAPGYGYASFILGLIEEDAGEHQAAIEALKNVPRTDRVFDVALRAVGEIYFDKLFDYQSAYEKFSELSAANANDKEIAAELAEASLAVGRFQEAHALAGRLLAKASRPSGLRPDQQLVMRFVMIASLVLQGEAEKAHKALEEFVTSYRCGAETYNPRWSFEGTKRSVTQRSMDERKRTLLMKLIAILETPTPEVALEPFAELLK